MYVWPGYTVLIRLTYMYDLHPTNALRHAIPIKCFVSHRPLFREVIRSVKQKKKTRDKKRKKKIRESG